MTRCTAPGVVRCVGFDTASDFVGTYGDNHGTLPGDDHQPARDTSVRASGSSSLRFTVSTSASNSAGAYFTNFSDDLLTQFGANQSFYVQWRQRFSSSYLALNPPGAGGWKLNIIGQGDKPGCTANTSANGQCASSCTALEVVTQNTNQSGFAQMYNSCSGSTSHGPYDGFEEPFGAFDFKLQNARPSPYCLYSQNGAQHFPPQGNCFGFFPNEWMTFQVEITTGPRVGDEWRASRVRLWIARESSSSELVIDWGPYALTAGAPAEDLKFGKVWLLPYNTNNTSPVSLVPGNVWYDELIVSRNRIADPGSAGGGSAGGGSAGGGSAGGGSAGGGSAGGGSAGGGSAGGGSAGGGSAGGGSAGGGSAGGVPGYIAALAPFQVRALSGALSPANGRATMLSVTPTSGALGNWVTMDPGVGPDGLVTAWCGGAKPLSGTRLYVHGGGHNDSANNGLYVFDYAGNARPTGWTLPSISPISAVVPGSAAYSDGLPTSSHTADTSCFLNGMMYRISSIPYNPVGGFGHDAWKYDPTSNLWTRLADSPTSSCYVFPNDATNKILCVDRWASYFGYYFYNATSNTYSQVKTVAEQWPSYFTVAYKPLTATTGLALISGSGESFSSIVDWNAETLTQVSRTLGTVSQSPAPGCFYDPTSDRFWQFGGKDNPALVDEINPQTWAVVPHTLSGDLFTFASDYNGTFSRFVFMPQYRAVGLVPSTSAPAYVFRLP